VSAGPLALPAFFCARADASAARIHMEKADALRPLLAINKSVSGGISRRTVLFLIRFRTMLHFVKQVRSPSFSRAWRGAAAQRISSDSSLPIAKGRSLAERS